MQTMPMDPTDLPDTSVDGTYLDEMVRRQQEIDRQQELELLKNLLGWIAAEPAVALAAAAVEQQGLGWEPREDYLPFEVVLDYYGIHDSCLEGHVRAEVLHLHRELSDDLERMFLDAKGLAGQGPLSPTAFLTGADWAIQRDRARRALSLLGLERDDQLLFAEVTE